MIRIPNIPDLQGSAINAPPANARAMGASGEALGRVAQGIADVSEAFHQTALRIQKIENARELSERRFKLAEDYSAMSIELQKDPEPESRLNRMRAFLDQRRGSLESEDMAPALRDAMKMHFEDFASRAVIRQAEESANLSVQRGKLAFQNEIAAAMANQDRAGLEMALDTAQEAGVILPEERDPFISDFERSVTGTHLDMGIEADPEMVLFDIEKPGFLERNPGLTEADLPRLKSAANSSIQRKRAEEMDMIEAALIEGKLTPQDLESAVYLTPKDRARAKAALSDSRPPDTSKHSKAWDHLFKLRDEFNNPAVSNEEYAAKWNDARSNILDLLPPAFQGDLKQELSYRSPANRSLGAADSRPDAAARDYATLATSRIKKAFDDGLLGDVTDPKSAEAKAAFTRMEDARAAVIRFIKQNPQATFPEIREFTTKALGGALDDGDDGGLLIPAGPPPVSFDTRLNDLLGIPGGTAEGSDALLPPKP
jgi:hypothetical protein